MLPFKLIAITPETTMPDETKRICRLLDAGFDYVHIRKPHWQEDEIRRFITEIPTRYRGRLKLHDHFRLANELQLAGIHLNSRNPEVPVGYSGQISKSCHSLQELQQTGCFDYVFLSPVFDSICKQGYRSNFSEEELSEAAPLLNEKVVALGGITADKISRLRRWGFGGGAFLGYLFGTNDPAEFNNRLESIIKQTQ